MSQKIVDNKTSRTESSTESNATRSDKIVPSQEIGGFQRVEDFTKDGLSLIVEATKAVNVFPSGAARDLYCAYPTFGKVVDTQSDRILRIISGVLQHQNIRGNIQRRQKDEQFELLLECNDVMLERINTNLDELVGIRKNSQTLLVESKLPTTLVSTTGGGSWNVRTDNTKIKTARLITAKNIARPQVSFKTPIDNKADHAFEPRLKEKPNSLKPLAILPEYDEDGNIESYLHPYEFELDKFVPPQEQLIHSDPQIPKKIENTPFMYVDEVYKLKELIAEVKDEKEIAIDLEHHSYRTFQGITCLMQISTRKKDYIIDTLKLRDELHILNEVFTNPKVQKIFHGADSDIVWLQRDLSLYVVNMFDTHQAAKLLSFPRLSLAYLLKYYCDIEIDKTFQLADWRIRPLPNELIMYARQDTHFLIYIYELLRNDLLKQGNDQSNLLKMVYQKSTELCKKRYIKPKIHSDSHIELYRKAKRVFDNRQLFALKEIFFWRDKTSRQEDESYGYVLPNHMMLQISESLPREMQGILACCNPIPPLVRQNLHTLHQIVLKAREQPLVKPIINDAIENRTVARSTNDFNSKLNCPHDLSHNPEFRDDLPTLIGAHQIVEDNDVDSIEAQPIINLFEVVKNPEKVEIGEKLQKLKDIKFISPYGRYKAVAPYAEKQRLEELNKESEMNNSKQLCPIKQQPVDTKPEEAERSKQDESSLSLNQMRKRKHKEDQQQQKDVKENAAKKPKKDDNYEGSDKLEFIEKVKEKVKNPKERNATFPINVKSDRNMSQDASAGLELSQTDCSTSQESSNQNKKKKNKKNKKFTKNTTGQSSSQPVQFDYSKVNFKNFQGGSQSAKGTEIKPKFKGKGQNNKVNNKKFNKLFMFSNVNKKK